VDPFEDEDGSEQVHLDGTEAIVWFVKDPAPGHVKTRLYQATDGCLSPEDAALLYTAFLQDMWDTLNSSGRQVYIHIDPSKPSASLDEVLGEKVNLVYQSGADLGERMSTALCATFSLGYDRVILLGSDSPDVPSSFLEEAFDILAVCDVVLGPAYDGGYYLVGASADTYTPMMFDGMKWSTPSVLGDQISRLIDMDREHGLLPTWWDIDTPSDLESAVRRWRDGTFRAERTLKVYDGLRL